MSFRRFEHRDWLQIRDLWIGHLPIIDFSLEYPSPMLWDIPGINAVGTEDNVLVPLVAGAREAIFREALVLTRKFVYCLQVMKVLVAMGRTTWTAVVGYEACFYGAKAFCYMLGFASLGRDSHYYIDAFVSTVEKRGKKKIDVFNSFKVHKLSDRMTHVIVWSMFDRLIETTTFHGGLADMKRELRREDWSKFPKFRNRMMYEGGFWPFSDQINDCDLHQYISNLEVYNNLFNGSHEVSFAGEYFAACRNLLQTLGLMLEGIEELAPAISPQRVAIQNLEIPPLF